MSEFKIDGVEYKITPLVGENAYSLLSEMIAIAGEGAQFLPQILRGAMLDEEGDDGETAGVGAFYADIASFAACSAMIKESGYDTFAGFRRKIIETAMKKRPSGAYEQVKLDTDFLGNLVGAEKLFDHCIEAHFGPFSKGSEASGPVALALILIRNVFQVKKQS